MRIVLVAGSLEPGVLVGRVVHDQVHDDLQAALVRFGKQLVHIGHRAEQRVDVLVVGDVVLRGPVHRGQPQHVHAKVGKIVEAAGDALQIADAVAIGILEGTGIDLVDHRVGPPWIRGGAIRTDVVRKSGTIEIRHRD